MTKRVKAKYKIDRRLEVNLWGRSKSPINTRNYGPGQHGQQRSKPSDYGVQLRAKQKLKGYYGNIGERQFLKIYKKATHIHGDTSENLVGLLESRLDSIVYRMKLAPTPFSSRQFINHGHIYINGSRVNIPSYRVRLGDEISITDRMKKNIVVQLALGSNEREVPQYIQMNQETLSGKLINIPKLSDIPYPTQMDPNLVVEFYSR